LWITLAAQLTSTMLVVVEVCSSLQRDVCDTKHRMPAVRLSLLKRCVYKATQVAEYKVAESAPRAHTRFVCVILATVGQFSTDTERRASLSTIAEPLVF